MYFLVFSFALSRDSMLSHSVYRLPEKVKPKRDAGSNGSVGPPEEHTLPGELVQLRGAQGRMAQDGQTVATHLIGHDQEDVRPGRISRSKGSRKKTEQDCRQDDDHFDREVFASVTHDMSLFVCIL